MASGPKPRPVAERFAEKVAFAGPDECWLWQGKLNPNGYGSMVIGSRSDGTRRSVIASRLSYEIHNGSIPENLSVCHRCDNPPCVNPTHLFAGTWKDNAQDALAKGRLRQPDASRTHCGHGHELTPENTYYDGRVRLCRECRRERSRRHYARNPDQQRARSRRAYMDNPETHRDRSLAYYKAHRDERLPKMREYYQRTKGEK